jgi:hypothetical protein
LITLSEVPKMAAAPLTPGLTPQQRIRVSDALTRIGNVPRGSVAMLFMDVDRAAARALDPLTADASRTLVSESVAMRVATEHKLAGEVVAYAYGLAVGIRLGTRFAPRPKRSKQWISEEYKQLNEDYRRLAARIIRDLLKVQGSPRSTERIKRGSANAEAMAARKWVREMGRAARRGKL